jgi:hypothetical protein
MLRCVIVGDSFNTMKTKFLTTYVKGRYPDDYVSTVFDNYSVKVREVSPMLSVSVLRVSRSIVLTVILELERNT